MVSSSARWVVLTAVLFAIVGCQPAKTVTRQEFRAIVFPQSSTAEVVFDYSDDQYDYYHVNGKPYRVAHVDPTDPYFY